MSSQAKPEPVIIRQVNESIWTFSKAFKRGGIVPFGGRSTAIRTSLGYLVVASTPLTPETKATLSSAPVKYIVSPDSVHWLFISEWAKAYPEAKVYGVEDVVPKQDWANLGVKWAGVFSKENPTGSWPEELKDEVKVEWFKGFINQDLALLHVPTKTLVEADLLFNLPAYEQFSQPGHSPHLWYLPVGWLKPDTWFHRFFLSGAAKDKTAMAESAAVVASWDFEKVIPCHGDVIESGGKKAFTSTYSNFLKDHKKAQ